MTRLTKFIARFLGLWSPHELPGPFQGRIQGADYDVQPLPGGMVSISIHLPRDRMVIQPELIRRPEELNWSRGIEKCTYPLFRMGAQSIDVASNSDRLEVFIPGEVVRVDKPFAEEAVSLMVWLRNEATGQQPTYVLQRPWAKEVESTIEVDEESVTFELSSCLLDTDEEAGTLGNLDVMVRTSPRLLPEKLTENLRLEVPGCDELLYSDSHGQFDDVLDLGFSLAGMSGLDGDRDREWRHGIVNVLQKVNIYWGGTRETKLATLRCVGASENA